MSRRSSFGCLQNGKRKLLIKHFLLDWKEDKQTTKN